MEDATQGVETTDNWLAESTALITAGISGFSGSNLFEYAAPLQRIALKLQDESGGGKVLRAIRVLHDVIEFTPNADGDVPFTRYFDVPGSQTLGLDDLTDEDALLLEAALACSGQALYRSRLADVLWLVTKQRRFAQIAIEEYLRLIAETPLSSWTSLSDPVDRLAALACSLGPKCEERARVKARLVELFREAITETQDRDLLHWPSALARTLLRHFRKEEWKAVSDGSLAFAETASLEGRGTYLELASDASRIGGDEAARRAAQRALGDHWVREAERSQEEPDGIGRELVYFRSAIEAYREAGEKALADQQIPRLQAVNQRFVGSMTESRIELEDGEELIREAEKVMAGALGKDALRAFVRLHRPTNYEYAKETLKSLSQGMIHTIFPTVHLTPEGNLAKITPGQTDPSADPSTGAVSEFYRIGQGVAGVMLEHARGLIHRSNDRSWEAALRAILERSDFVPERRRIFFERAIIGGFQGDGALLAHLIIPQLENSLRTAVGEAGGKKTTVKSDGTMREKDLNELLRDPVTISMLGVDLTWEARSLLTEQPEPNLRNRVCHGLADPGNCEGPIAAVLLWLTLVLIVLFVRPDLAPTGE